MLSNITPQPVLDYWLLHAIQVIASTYGDEVSIRSKNKDLHKFGRNELIGTTKATIQQQPAGVLHETYVSSNLINTIISTSGSDTEEVIIEGFTIDGNNDFTFIKQTLSLTGQTAKALTTNLARVVRVYNNDSTELVGVISVTETDTYTAGVPATNSKVHLQMGAGAQQSAKCSTTISSDDYLILTSLYGDILSKTAAFAEIQLEIRNKGKVFRTITFKGASDGHDAERGFKPYLIIPPNSDIRITAVAGSANTDIAAGIEGILVVKREAV